MRGKIILTMSVITLIIILILMDIRITPFATLETTSNLKIELPESYSQVQSGSEIWFTIKLLSLEELGRRDVTLKYEVVDENEKIVATKSETVAVETQASFVDTMQIPGNTPLGKYKLKAYLITESETKEAEVSFSIVELPKNKGFNFYLLILIPVLLIIIFLILKGKSVIEKLKIKSKVHKIVKQRSQI